MTTGTMQSASRLTPHPSTRFASGQAVSLLAQHWDSLFLFAASLSLYTFTLSPDILPADSGEFQVVVPLLGVAHPPGFALYTLLGRLFIALIPIGTPAYRLNLFSAFLGALTLAVVNRTVYRLACAPQGNAQHAAVAARDVSRFTLVASRLPGLLAAFTLGVSTTFWSQATTANIRSLAALLTAFLVYTLVEYRLHPTPNRLALFALTLSGAVVHHLSLAFIAIVFAVAIIWLAIFPSTDVTASRATDKKKHPFNPFHPLTKTFVIKFLLAALAPLLTLLYLPLRGSQAAFLAPPGLDTLAGFFQHVFASGFGGDFFYFANLAALPDRLAILLNTFLFQFNAPTLIFLTIGLVFFFRRDRMLATALALAFVVHCFVAITYRAPQTVEYLLPAYVILAIASAAGSGQWAERSRQSAVGGQRLGWFDFAHHKFGIWFSRAFCGLCLGFLFALFIFTRNFPAYAALSRDHSTRDYAASALALAPPDAVILSAWHFATPMWYLQQIEGLRPDVTVEYVFPQGMSLAQNWAAGISANAPNRPTLITNFYPTEYAATPYRFIPTGALWQAVSDPPTAPPPDLTPVNAPYAQHWTLLAANVTQTTISPGETFSAVVAWQAPLAPTDVNFFVQLLGSDGLLYGQMDVSHSQIAPDEIVSDRYDITPNVDAAPGEYKLVAGAYLPDGHRLAPGFTELATVSVAPRSTPPATRHPQLFGLVAGYDYDLSIPDSPHLYIHWRLDGQPHELALQGDGKGLPLLTLQGDHRGSPLRTISLPASSGYFTTALDLPLDWQTIAIAEFARSSFIIHRSSFSSSDRYVSFGPLVLTRAAVTRDGGSYRVDLDWLADKPLTDDLIVKVDLIGENYSWRVQSDSVPAGGAIPTLKWIPGIVIQDRHRLTPATPTPASFQLAVYDHFTLHNLPALDSRLALLGPTVPLGVAQP